MNLKIKHIKYNTYPPVVHCLGPWSKKSRHSHGFFSRFNMEFFSQPVSPQIDAGNLTILTWNTKQTPCLLEKSVAHLGLNCVVLGRGLKKWSDSKKIPLLLEGLQNVTTPYVLAVDGFDVIVIGELPYIINTFKTFKTDILFGATNGKCGLRSIYKINNKIFKNHHLRHLCAGTLMGKTESLKQFYEVALKTIPIIEKITVKERKSWASCKRLSKEGRMIDDQTVIRAIAPMFIISRYQYALFSVFQSVMKSIANKPLPIVKLDHRCQIFANIHKTTAKYYKIER